MKHIITIIIGFSFLLFLNQGCSRKEDKQEFEKEKTIPITFNPDKFPPLDSFISEIKVIPLETNDKCLLRDQLRGIKVYQGLIYINNMNCELYVFDLNGKFIREIGRRGQGPGEFLEVRDFIFTNENTIELLDYQKIECYTLEGIHIGTKRFNTISAELHCNPSSFCRSFSSIYYLWGGMMDGGDSRRHEKANLLYRLNSDMQIEAGFFDTKIGDGGSMDRFKYYQDLILFIRSSLDYNVYQIDRDDSVSIRYTFDFGKYGTKVGKDVDDRITVIGLKENFVSDINYYHETDHIIYFNFSYKKRNHCFLYSKATGQSFIKTLAPYLNEKEVRLFQIKAICNDLLVSVVDISWLKMDLERMSLENIKKWGFEECHKLNDEDNPVLILYKTKF